MEAVYYQKHSQAPWGNTLREMCNTYANWSGREVHINDMLNGNVASESIHMGTTQMHGTSLAFRAFRVVTAIGTLGIFPLLAELFSRLLSYTVHKHTLNVGMLPPNTIYAHVRWIRSAKPKVNVICTINGVEYKHDATLELPKAGKVFVPMHLDHGELRLFLAKPLSPSVPEFAALQYHINKGIPTLRMDFFVDANIGGSDEMRYYKRFKGSRAEWMFNVATKHQNVTLEWILNAAYCKDFESEECDEQRNCDEQLKAMKQDFIALMQADDRAKYNELSIDQQSEFDAWSDE